MNNDEVQEVFRDGFDQGYNEALDVSGQRVPLLVTLAAVVILFGLGWLVGHYT